MTARNKTDAQLARDISRALAAPAAQASTNTPHSAKALATLRGMGTEPSQWRLTPIEWVEEEREVPGLVTCPTCRGHKFVRIEADGRVIPRPPLSSTGGNEYHDAARREAHRAGRLHGNCPTCARRQGGWGMIPQGKVKGVVRAMVMVGYPKFPSGTRFDSRFAGGLHCHLCNKLIMRSHRVPVHGTGGDGVTHGMFVGEDCARKFLDVKLKRDEDSIMESGNGPTDP